MLIVLGSARVLPARRDEFDGAARAVTASSVDEPGCRGYGFYADLGDPDTVLSVEMWDDQSALDTHMGEQHVTDFLGQLPELLDGEPAVAVHLTTEHPAPNHHI